MVQGNNTDNNDTKDNETLHFKMNFNMLYVIMLGIFMLSANMLNVIILSLIMLSVNMFCVIMLSVLC
jgi:hypothetical protein